MGHTLSKGQSGGWGFGVHKRHTGSPFGLPPFGLVTGPGGGEAPRGPFSPLSDRFPSFLPSPCHGGAGEWEFRRLANRLVFTTVACSSFCDRRMAWGRRGGKPDSLLNFPPAGVRLRELGGSEVIQTGQQPPRKGIVSLSRRIWWGGGVPSWSQSEDFPPVRKQKAGGAVLSLFADAEMVLDSESNLLPGAELQASSGEQPSTEAGDRR